MTRVRRWVLAGASAGSLPYAPLSPVVLHPLVWPTVSRPGPSNRRPKFHFNEREPHHRFAGRTVGHTTREHRRRNRPHRHHGARANPCRCASPTIRPSPLKSAHTSCAWSNMPAAGSFRGAVELQREPGRQGRRGARLVGQGQCGRHGERACRRLESHAACAAAFHGQRHLRCQGGTHHVGVERRGVRQRALRHGQWHRRDRRSGRAARPDAIGPQASQGQSDSRRPDAAIRQSADLWTLAPRHLGTSGRPAARHRRHGFFGARQLSGRILRRSRNRRHE